MLYKEKFPLFINRLFTGNNNSSVYFKYCQYFTTFSRHLGCSLLGVRLHHILQMSLAAARKDSGQFHLPLLRFLGPGGALSWDMAQAQVVFMP